MRYVKWVFWIAVILLVGGFLHYTLPKRDIVYVTGVEIKLEQFGENSIFWASPDTGASAAGGVVERDVRFIDTVQRNGKVKVYRNEDTGWGWPPYFKLDSSNLQAEARNLVSNQDNPRWAVIRYYGWRIPALTIFPNAVTIKATDTPDKTLIPWLNIVVLTVLFAIFWAIRVRWLRFWRNRIDPMVTGAEDSINEKRGRFNRWLGTWRKK